MRALAWMPGKESAVPISADEMLSLRKKRTAVLWADYPAPTEQDFEFLSANFGFDPLALRECRRDGNHRATVTDRGEYLFIAWPVLVDDPATLEVESEAIFFFLGPNYLVTLHRERHAVLDGMNDRTISTDEVAIEGSDWLLLRIVGRAIDDFFPTIDRLTDRLDELEDIMFEEPHRDHITELFKIKHAMLNLRRMAAPERDVVNALGRHESRLIDRQTYVYFQDAYDHLARITDSIDTARDIINGAMDIYLSSLSNRMNDIMKRLTVVATIFMPITFITSFYGMNIVGLPLATYRPVFWVLFGLMLAISVGMLIDFRRRGWW